MKSTYFRSSIILSAVFIFVFLTVTNVAYPPLLRQSRKFGAKDCTFCHKEADGGEALTDRGKWLVTERTRRGAGDIDVEWLKDYSEKTAETKSAATPVWAEQATYHEVMFATFKASADGNLVPTRERASELMQKATAWLESKPPKDHDTAEMREKLTRLVAYAKALTEVVDARAGDDDVRKSLIALHDHYHQIIDGHTEKK